MTTSISPEERLLNLVIALMNTTSHMTRAQIVASVAGYDAAASPSAVERMFERDKDTLRKLGLPLLTIEDAGHATDIGYRIDKDSYGLGEFDFTPSQFSVLSLAASLWQENSVFATDSSQAMTKLRSGYQGHGDTDSLVGLAPRLTETTGLSDHLIDSITERRTVTFDYRTGGSGQVSTRTVQPWRVAVRSGAWYLVGQDVDKNAPRVFRLSRFESKIKAARNAAPYVVPTHVDVDELLGRRVEAPTKTATLAIRTDRAQVLRRRGISVPIAREMTGYDFIEVPFTSAQRFSEEIVGYGDAVLVLEPDNLKQAVLTRLTAAVALPIERK